MPVTASAPDGLRWNNSWRILAKHKNIFIFSGETAAGSVEPVGLKWNHHFCLVNACDKLTELWEEIQLDLKTLDFFIVFPSMVKNNFVLRIAALNAGFHSIHDPNGIIAQQGGCIIYH